MISYNLGQINGVSHRRQTEINKNSAMQKFY